MKTSFFSKYPGVNYDLYGDGSLMELTNITQEVMVTPSKLPDDASIYTYYSIRDGDRPDIISYNLYGDVQYYWTFFILNSSLKNGLNAAWPLSYLDFNKMIESEYSAYSVITFRALESSDIDGKAVTDFSITELSSKYLPYLRLNDISGHSSKILKYDALRQQLIVYNITNNARDIFLSSSSYTLSWDDSIHELDAAGNEISPTNEDLKNEWLQFMFDMFKKYNPINYTLITESLSDTLSDDEILQIFYNNIFSTSYIPVSFKVSGVSTYPYNWSLYYNAACIYYDAESNIITAYDSINNNTIEPLYKSFHDVEYEENEAKSKIKIIRADKIMDFSNSYFAVLTE